MRQLFRYLVIFAIIAVIVPAVGWLGHSHGARIRRGAAMAALLLGFEVPFDPPRRPPAEARAGEPKGPTPGGDPPGPQSETSEG